MAFFFKEIFFSGLVIWISFVVVEALINIRDTLRDLHRALNIWDPDSVNACSWAMITCSPENFVIGL